MPDPADYIAALQLHAAYARALDDDRLEDWLDLFAETCTYRIVTRENLAQDLPLALMQCDSRAMLRDRVVSLRHANIFNIHTDRHLIANLVITAADAETLSTEADYASFQTDQDGRSAVFSVGRYRDRLVRTPAGLRIADKLVIADTAEVKRLLATPL